MLGKVFFHSLISFFPTPEEHLLRAPGISDTKQYTVIQPAFDHPRVLGHRDEQKITFHFFMCWAFIECLLCARPCGLPVG